MRTALDDVVALLDLEAIEVNTFRGRSPDDDRQRIFGGQVAGQALVAAARTVDGAGPPRGVHSLHAYFLRPGDPKRPVLYEVDRIRDGRSFTTRRVVAIQHGRAIFQLAASFHIQEEGYSHLAPMPEVPDPETLQPRQWQGRRRSASGGLGTGKSTRTLGDAGTEDSTRTITNPEAKKGTRTLGDAGTEDSTISVANGVSEDGAVAEISTTPGDTSKTESTSKTSSTTKTGGTSKTESTSKTSSTTKTGGTSKTESTSKTSSTTKTGGTSKTESTSKTGSTTKTGGTSRTGGQAPHRPDRSHALDIRYVTATSPYDRTAPLPPRQQVWMRANGTLSDDPVLHNCLLTYASDLTLLDTALLPHQTSYLDHDIMLASLDHAMWFHGQFRADEWLLYDQHTPAATGARGLATGRVFTRDGRLAASVVQEGLIRRIRTVGRTG